MTEIDAASIGLISSNSYSVFGFDLRKSTMTFRSQLNLHGGFQALSALAFVLCITSSVSAFSGSNRVVAYTSWKNQFFWVDANGNGYFRLAQGSGSTQSFWVQASNLGGDPAVGHVKQLSVTCTVGEARRPSARSMAARSTS